MTLLQSSYRTLGTMENETKKLKLIFRTCIQVKPILSTIEKYDGPLMEGGGRFPSPIFYKMQVKLEGQMTAYSSSDWSDIVVRKDNGLREWDDSRGKDNDTLDYESRNEVSSWLRDAIASGEVEVELVNESTPIKYEDRETWARKMMKPRDYSTLREYSKDELDDMYRSAYDGADGVNFDGEAM